MGLEHNPTGHSPKDGLILEEVYPHIDPCFTALWSIVRFIFLRILDTLAG